MVRLDVNQSDDRCHSMLNLPDKNLPMHHGLHHQQLRPLHRHNESQRLL
jgi:hypothetical protein